MLAEPCRSRPYRASGGRPLGPPDPTVRIPHPEPRPFGPQVGVHRRTTTDILCDVPEPILIDTDTASDDAVALIMALRSPAVRVIGISTVAGNVRVEQATRNALYTAELCGADTPVYQGAGRPLARPLATADWFHGQDGLGDHGYQPPSRSAEKQYAIDAIIEIIY